ncbi:hypothetical protein B1A99_15585 [Cohnella sp. CIP 111063]|uniref:hypothetical protein n=1 Tax=unclassified Cohnella TaxID=2636738 RepID=UPI000B8C4DCD|nr:MULTISPECIES: hypothetical protein [unclassified Cohnella]OXS58050.1 hypothetical protein B1A99_15585 [Cohnella sp. CIP 111063]PRX71388.1 hypothetical protein B0G52_109186 [Cohnella sp. SGD-V74]
MTIDMPVFMRIWSVLLLSASLVSCSSSSTDTSPTSSASPSASAPTDVKVPLRESQPSEPATGQSPATKEELSSGEAPSTGPSEPPEPSEPSVEASTVQPSLPPEGGTSENPGKHRFLAKSPSLAHLKLGYTDKEVVKRYGLPEETYPLPGDEETIEIWEYDGLSVGLNEQDKVVYIEISSKKVDTGIENLDYGMNGSQAAELLGLPGDGQMNVLSLEVTGGWLKIDLDPDTQKVLSLKLLDL